MPAFQSSRRAYGATSCFDQYNAEYKKYIDLMWKEPIFTAKRVDYENRANAALSARDSCGITEVATTLSGGASTKSCAATYDAEYKKYLDLMGKSNLFSAQRVDYERKANAALEKKKLCGESTGIFEPGASPETLWTMAYSKRKADVSGVFGPEDTIIAVAKGMNPGLLSGLEDRAVIKGGLHALFLAGLETKDPSTMKVTTLNLKKDDEELIRAAGGKITGNVTKDLSSAAKLVRDRVSKEGSSLKRTAWGLRGIYVLGTLVGFQIAHGLTTTVTGIVGAFFWPVAVASAVIGAHGAISKAIADNIALQMNGYVKSGIMLYGEELAKRASAAAKPVVSARTRTTGGARGAAARTMVSGGAGGAGSGGLLASVPTWGWVLGGLAVAGTTAYLVLKK